MLFPDLEPIQAVEVVDWLATCGGMHLDSVLPAVIRALRAIPLALAALDAASKGEEIEEREEDGDQLLAKLSALTDALIRFVLVPHGGNNPLKFTRGHISDFTLSLVPRRSLNSKPCCLQAAYRNPRPDFTPLDPAETQP